MDCILAVLSSTLLFLAAFTLNFLAYKIKKQIKEIPNFARK